MTTFVLLHVLQNVSRSFKSSAMRSENSPGRTWTSSSTKRLQQQVRRRTAACLLLDATPAHRYPLGLELDTTRETTKSTKGNSKSRGEAETTHVHLLTFTRRRRRRRRQLFNTTLERTRTIESTHAATLARSTTPTSACTLPVLLSRLVVSRRDRKFLSRVRVPDLRRSALVQGMKTVITQSSRLMRCVLRPPVYVPGTLSKPSPC